MVPNSILHLARRVPLLLVLLFTMSDDIAETFVVKIPQNIRREGTKHLLTLEGESEKEKMLVTEARLS